MLRSLWNWGVSMILMRRGCSSMWPWMGSLKTWQKMQLHNDKTTLASKPGWILYEFLQVKKKQTLLTKIMFWTGLFWTMEGDNNTVIRPQFGQEQPCLEWSKSSVVPREVEIVLVPGRKLKCSKKLFLIRLSYSGYVFWMSILPSLESEALR